MAGLRIALAQLDLWVGDIAGNAARVIEAASEARDALGARLIVFPELTLTSYPHEDLVLRPAEVEAVLMPSRYTAAMSVEDARAQADLCLAFRTCRSTSIPPQRTTLRCPLPRRLPP